MTIAQAELTLIVRECGERTADACVSLLSSYFPGHTVHRVSGRPFHVTLRRSLELGLREGRPWMLCIDADVLALPNIIAFAEGALRLPQHVFGIQALVLDKLLRVNRPAGNHVYRTELIASALPYIPTEGTLRPETTMIEAMSRNSFPFYQSLDIIGLHDFEQFPQDIYAKAFLHGHKHRHLTTIIEPLWRVLAEQDTDYLIAQSALDEALRSMEVVVVGRDITAEKANTAAEMLGIAEKTTLGIEVAECVQRILEVDLSLSGEAAQLRTRLQQMINAELEAQERARYGNAVTKQSKARSLLELLKAVLSRTIRSGN